jgi:hypothetical protein
MEAAVMRGDYAAGEGRWEANPRGRKPRTIDKRGEGTVMSLPISCPGRQHPNGTGSSNFAGGEAKPTQWALILRFADLGQKRGQDGRRVVKHRRVVLPAGVLAVISMALMWNGKQVIGDEWLPISQEELKMTSEPKAPGAPAIILYHQVDRDDSNPKIPHEYNYVRKKIFTEEGRKYADVDIPVVKDQWNVIREALACGFCARNEEEEGGGRGKNG